MSHLAKGTFHGQLSSVVDNLVRSARLVRAAGLVTWHLDRQDQPALAGITRGVVMHLRCPPVSNY